MPDLDTHLRRLRKLTFDGGHQFSDTIGTRLAALNQAARDLRDTLPENPRPEDLPALRAHLTNALLPAYRHLVSVALSPTDLSTAFREWVNALNRDVESLPEQVESVEPERLHEPSSNDGPMTTVRKGMVRLGRRFDSAEGPRMREVPLQGLGTALAREWLPVQFGKVIDNDRKQIARHQFQLEKAFSDVVYAILRAENRWRLTAEQPPVDDAVVPEGSDHDTPSAVESNGESRAPFDEAMGRLTAALEILENRLSESNTAFTSAAASDIERRMEQAWVPLQAEVERAGSFMSEIPSIGEDVFRKRMERIDAQADAWREWKERLNARGDFLQTLATLRNEMDLLVDSMEGEVTDKLVKPIRQRAASVASSLLETEDQLKGKFSQSGKDLFDRRSGSVKALGEDAVHRVQEDLVEPIQELSLLTRIPDENQAFLAGLTALVENLPDPFRLHPLAADPDDPIQPEQDPRVVPLKELVRNGLAEIDSGKLENRTAEAREDLKETLEELVSLPSIVRFSFESATESSGEEQQAESESKDPDQLLAMMEESLKRTRDAIGTIGERIETSAAMLLHVYRVQTLHAWIRIQDRLQVEHQVGAYVMDVRSRLDAEAREAGQRLARLTRQVRLLSERLFHRSQREAKALIERGKEAVGTPSPTRASFHDTALGLAELEGVLEGVPTVYRKLFSFQPLSDPDLLVGRTESLTFVENQLHQFDLGMPQAALLVGGPSSGRTSLLNILQTTDLAERTIRTLRFRERPDHPQALLELLAQSLELPIPDVDDIPEAARALLESMDPETAPICIVEHLEVLMLRGIGGYDLLVDMLQLMSLTDSRIVWIGTMSSFAWQLLKTADADSAALVNVHSMTDLSRPDLERLIMERHRKSGIPIEFSEPEDPSPLLRRKLRRVSSRDMRQQILKEAFFDRLFSQFGQNIQMALLQWIRSIRMSEDASSMQVVPTPALNLSFFAGFNMDQVFALKAILEHGSLSPDEYATIDRIPEDKSLTLFETLGNALVIETTERRDTGKLYRHSAVDASSQYRIRPLFSHAVIRLLRERNVVH